MPSSASILHFTLLLKPTFDSDRNPLTLADMDEQFIKDRKRTTVMSHLRAMESMKVFASTHIAMVDALIMPDPSIPDALKQRMKADNDRYVQTLEQAICDARLEAGLESKDSQTEPQQAKL
jgi:hypothetical protein